MKMDMTNANSTDKRSNTYGLTEDARAERARYLREWRARNKDKTREYRRTYWERKAEKAMSLACEEKK